MRTKFGFIINNIKSVNSSKIIDKINSSTSSIVSSPVVKNISTKYSKVEKLTTAEIEKIVSLLVNSLLKNNPKETVTDEVKNEIVKKFTTYNGGKNIIPLMKYVNSTLFKNVPKNMNAAKNFKKNIVETLIQDATNSLEEKRKVAAH